MLSPYAPCNSDQPATIDSGAIALSAASEVLVAGHAGAVSACDVWFNVPADWEDRVSLRVYARLGASRVLVRQVALARVGGTAGPGGTLSGLAMSIRGRPCNGFEVTAVATAGPSLSNGRFFLQVWHAAVEPSTSGGGPIPEVPTAVPMVAATLLAVDSTGALRQVRADSNGRLLAGTSEGGGEYLLLAAPAGVSENVFTRIAALRLAMPAGVAATLTATLETSNPSNAAQLRLFDVTDAAVVSDATLSTTSTLGEELTTGVSTSTAQKIYELQLRLANDGAPARAICTRAVIRLDPI
jgi:hypothetical protein